MFENILTPFYGAAVLLFGVTLTAAFSGIRWTRKNAFVFLGLSLFCGAVQLAATIFHSPEAVQKLYPLITHFPLVLVLTLVYRKKLSSALAATFTAYLCCQPSKWVGILIYQLLDSLIAQAIAWTVTLLLVGYWSVFHVAPCLAEIFNKDRRSVTIFGIVPAVYYAFDYCTVVYTDLWISNNRAAAEFLPFFLAVAYVIFCFVYYKEYEQKTEAQRRAQIIRIAVEQQAKEINVVKHSEQEIRLLRHDMRHLLSTLAVSIDNNELDNAQELIASFISHIDGTCVERFCSIGSINYVLSDYATKCNAESIPFHCVVELQALHVDEIYFCSILSNALENALNAQKSLPYHLRNIRVMLKTSDNRLLLSVKNPVGKRVVFVDGLPVSDKKGHGYGTQSIRFLTERLGGNCQFSVQDDTFILRVVL